jgi:3-dehydroquinate dehydratase-2
MLGSRDVEKYGSLTLKDIGDKIESEFPTHSFEFFQSNIEGELISKIQTTVDNFDGIIINPGGYAHTSVAIRDALADCSLPKIEVHLSHLANREGFRQVLLTASSCDGYVSGFKENSYLSGVYLLEKIINKV